MLKKGLIVAGVLAGLGFFFFGRDAVSYVATSVGWVKDAVADSVPMEFELERARTLVRELVPDIRKNMHVIAREEVEVQRLEKQISEGEQKQERDQTDLMRLKADLASGQAVFHYASRKYSADQVKLDLANRFERYKTSDATIASLREMHSARQRSVDAARQKLEAMLAAKTQLAVDIENLEARLKLVEAAQASSDVALDDSQLSRAKELIGDLRTRLDVAERMVNVEGAYHDEIPLDMPVPENIVDQVTEYFAPATPDSAELAQE